METTFRLAPSLASIVVGTFLLASGGMNGPCQWRARAGVGRAYAYLYAFRRCALGACLVVAGIAWAEQILWLLALCACVGIGEVLETTYYLTVMRWLPEARGGSDRGACDRARP